MKNERENIAHMLDGDYYFGHFGLHFRMGHELCAGGVEGDVEISVGVSGSGIFSTAHIYHPFRPDQCNVLFVFFIGYKD